jgi:hypothetical protein
MRISKGLKICVTILLTISSALFLYFLVTLFFGNLESIGGMLLLGLPIYVCIAVLKEKFWALLTMALLLIILILSTITNQWDLSQIIFVIKENKKKEMP